MLHGTIGSSVASRRPFGDPNWRHGTQCVLLLPRPAAGSGGPQPRGQRGWQRGTHSTGAISGQLGPHPSTSALRRQARWGDSGHTPRCRGEARLQQGRAPAHSPASGRRRLTMLATSTGSTGGCPNVATLHSKQGQGFQVAHCCEQRGLQARRARARVGNIRKTETLLIVSRQNQISVPPPGDPWSSSGGQAGRVSERRWTRRTPSAGSAAPTTLWSPSSFTPSS